MLERRWPDGSASRPAAWVSGFVILFLSLPVVAQERPSSRGFLGPPSPDSCFWTDRAFKDVPARDPASAPGVVLWSHGQNGGGVPSWNVGAPPVVRMFADKGWEVVLVQRNERCEGNCSQKGASYVTNMVEEVDKAKKAGYRRILVAGQSFGAGTVLDAAGKSTDIDGVMAFALSHGRNSCRDPKTFKPDMVPFHERMIKTGIKEARAPRILVSMGLGDHCVGMTFTPIVGQGLAEKNIAYIHFDESMRQGGHGAAVGREFAAMYGACVVAFFTRDEPPPPGRTVC
ncbi:MAG: hypothetical protein FJX55_14330 [Alphaproteobacteria bacterium]|nr:hypothetical protein [Alphaproteobacteria bacterium]